MNNIQEILSLVKEGKITEEEGVKLIEAMNEEKTSDIITTRYSDTKAEMLRIRAISVEGEAVKINIPVTLIKAGINLASKISLENEVAADIDWDSVMQMVEEGFIGEVLNAESSDGSSVVIEIR